MPAGTPISKFFARVLIVFLISGIAFYWLQQTKKEKQAEGSRRQSMKPKPRMSGNPLESWEKSTTQLPIGEWGFNRLPLYSLELERLFVRQDGRPILFVGPLHDVISSDGLPQCIFDTRGGLSWKLRFHLACTPDQAKLLTESHSPNSLQRFAVVTRVTSATKWNKGRGNYESQTSAPEFWVNGRCIDFLFVGSYLYELELLPPNHDMKQ